MNAAGICLLSEVAMVSILFFVSLVTHNETRCFITANDLLQFRTKKGFSVMMV